MEPSELQATEQPFLELLPSKQKHQIEKKERDKHIPYSGINSPLTVGNINVY